MEIKDIYDELIKRGYEVNLNDANEMTVYDEDTMHIPATIRYCNDNMWIELVYETDDAVISKKYNKEVLSINNTWDGEFITINGFNNDELAMFIIQRCVMDEE